MSKKRKKNLNKKNTNRQFRKMPYVTCKIEITKTNKDRFKDIIYFFKFDKSFICLFVCLLLSECLFNVIGFGIANIFVFIRIFSFTLFNTTLICLLTELIRNKKIGYIIRLIVLIFFDIYALLELQFKNFMEMYYSFISVSEGGITKIKDLIIYFIESIKPYYYLCLLPIVLYVFIEKKYKQKERKEVIKKLITLFASTSVLFIFFNMGSSIDLKENYLTHKDIEITFKNFGLEHTFLRDIVAIKYIKEEKIEIVNEIVEEPKETSRVIDDTDWNDLIEQEENENIKEIDNYLISRNVDDYNDMTGIYEDYNFIYILVESLDYLALDPDLTPTLYKMYEEGISFRNHYTPIYTCCTGDSDMMSLNSLMPLGSTCTYYVTQGLTYGSGLGNLFKNKGYDTYAFHNWTDQYYERSKIYPYSGFDAYYDYNDLAYKQVGGWPQDSQMFDLAYDVIKDSDKFFAYFVTCTMHFPFESSYTGNLYLDEINEKYPDYPLDIKRYISKSMDFDRGLENLINRLDEDGKLSNTVICFFPDHYPYIFGADYVLTYGNNVIERVNAYNGKDLTPFVIYNSESEPLIVDKICSTLDQAPTVANLFNLNYDPRLYMGNDIFSRDCTVIYNNGSFYNKYGFYSASNDTFTNFNGEGYSESYVNVTKQNVKNKITISKSIINNDYFKYRKSIVNANYEE